MRKRPWMPVVMAALLLTACGADDGGGSGSPTSPPGSAPSAPSSGAATSGDGRCIVRLHGKGGSGAETFVDDDGVSVVSPDGNAEGWGGRQWLYFPEEEYERAVAVLVDSTESCDEVIVHGFSNGGAFAAKLYCRGENLGGRLIRVVVDDPVVDGAVLECLPDPSVAATLYWTGALDATAQPGWDCAEEEWTCEGGTTIGIDAYAAALGLDVLPSGFDDHQPFYDAPELAEWTT